MPRVNPYRPQFDFPEQSASGALLFVGLLAAIVIAALIWASYNNSQPNLSAGSNFPQTQPLEPHTAPPIR